MDIYCLVFDDYETLDLMGPVEFLARIPNVKLHYVSQVGGLIRSKQGFYIETEKLEHLLPHSVLLVVGGRGTRQLVNDELFINQLGKWIDESEVCLSVCTGSALLACTGRLDSLKATSNKKSFDQVFLLVWIWRLGLLLIIMAVTWLKTLLTTPNIIGKKILV